ncbi:tRNA pseudouridine(38-40) synthase TruA [Rhabdothermincola sediminis]|uniref:tRNA pseudouridine(38-40) synthase TruA n=1 Tax=Rhabdothermincola sediminis TaxID=2751370 RepID=UPI001AA06E5F|nr:tRNA pseudouridine(38-40) synthase TruA [Rhabdothermincola sediminis]
MTLFDDDLGTGVEHQPGDDDPDLVRVRLVVAYDGSPYHGFAANPGVATVAGTLQRTIERVLRHPVELTGAGRTDRGVHAWGQVVSFDAPAAGLDLGALQRSINKLCGGTIVVREAAVAPPDFDARFSARSRTYRYTIVNRPVPDPFLAATSWWVDQPLDVAAMRLGCDPLIGEHDFSSFCRRPKDRMIGTEDDGDPGPSLVRRVIDARWDDEGDGVLRFTIEATAFCHQMVRSIVGTLVDVGLGRKRAGEVAGILRGRDRSLAGPVAPPQGLCLWRVTY